ncbi:DUF692 domain-containing protein [Catenovulum sediminis]|uniref:HvfB family MNIO-type RiPP peptide maturase n=1 Tax=Catenovulum sediminis TaxID=1740262 RepID=UPI00117D3AEA|nr:DUF692 domain-containing protein [Catenovulum sediminis]
MFDGLHGAGLGLRREFIEHIDERMDSELDFLEVAPENWIKMGGRYGHLFEQLTDKFQFTCHGLSLSIGSPDPLDVNFVKQVKTFLDKHNIVLYSEHLSFCSAQGHLYDLMPIPFTYEAAHYVANRVKQVQDIIERPLVLENVSYYTPLMQEISELEFTKTVLEESGALMLLDVNNVYVNSINHNYDAELFISGLPSEKVVYGHIAGHYNQDIDLIIDTHGADVIEPVWKLLEFAYQQHGCFPTLLERDFNIPSVEQMLEEVRCISKIQAAVNKLNLSINA